MFCKPRVFCIIFKWTFKGRTSWLIRFIESQLDLVDQPNGRFWVINQFLQAVSKHPLWLMHRLWCDTCCWNKTMLPKQRNVLFIVFIYISFYSVFFSCSRKAIRKRRVGFWRKECCDLCHTITQRQRYFCYMVLSFHFTHQCSVYCLAPALQRYACTYLKPVKQQRFRRVPPLCGRWMQTSFFRLLWSTRVCVLCALPKITKV